MSQRAFLLTLVPVLALAAAASAADPQGPAIGARRYQAAIVSVAAEPDVDDYVGSFLAGERLSVTVQAASRSALRPRIALVAPDGTVSVPASVVLAKGGRGAALRNFVLPTTGRWAVRISGEGGSQGGYGVTFKVAATRPISLNAVVLGGALGATVPFQGIDGALLDLKVTWKKGSTVTLTSIATPGGPSIPGTSVPSNATSIALRRFMLNGGDGTYGVRLVGAASTTSCRVDIRVTPQGRPSGKPISLAAEEPSLDFEDAPLSGVAGSHVHLFGSNFSTVDPPTVLFGGERALATVLAGGTEIDAIAPAMSDGTTVAIAVVAKDGQAAVRDAYFHYVELPTLSGLVNAYDAPIHTGRAAGGDELVVRGTGFAAGQTVRFGTAPATVVAVGGSTRIEVIVPAGVGSVPVYVVDAFGRAAQSSFLYDYKSAPGIDADPYSPDFGAVAGGTAITLTGSGFEPTDRLMVDGAQIAFTWIDSSSIRFVSPAKLAGSYSVGISDRYDAFAQVPAFQVKAAPQIAAVVAMNGPTSDPIEIDSTGGTLVQVTGSDFTSSDTVTLGGVVVAISSVSGGTLTFVAPAGAPGLADLVVTDAAGQQVTRLGALRFVAVVPPEDPPADE